MKIKDMQGCKFLCLNIMNNPDHEQELIVETE